MLYEEYTRGPPWTGRARPAADGDACPSAGRPLGTAYEAVKKLEHTKLKTKDSAGKPNEAGMKLFLLTLRERILLKHL